MNNYSGLLQILEDYLYVLISIITWTGYRVSHCENHHPEFRKFFDMPHIELSNVYKTKNRIISPFFNFFIGIHWESYHLVHHLFPRMLSWAYEEAHNILMKDSVYENLSFHKKTGFINMIKSILETPYKQLIEQ
ncbi:hypothetical protein IMG5_131020 [Ichthyophthirius multifiliis]|uniref:Fatty acid desaturase domain-containing protein n=1 Tax=Ichthyophthirius multifiliis TaxID=5932 RepID=G0QWC9_ICHMU|nr:hypothetical protein IMG5_131020 [Ichthyophthirius multifiliis]EGR30476.1 hypothetical protein IMG5_131020 [Ichthyophthirius multifiliis]|eukprot:XP_004032063.1 hypothetical protein IMG5_131020 [Ichthyophthirius multifiliis]